MSDTRRYTVLHSLTHGYYVYDRERGTPNGYAYTPHTVGAPCHVCGRDI